MNEIEMTTENCPQPKHVYVGPGWSLELWMLNAVYRNQQVRASARWFLLESYEGRPTTFNPDPAHKPMLADSSKDPAALDIPVTENVHAPSSPCISWADDLTEARARANTKGLQNGLLISMLGVTCAILIFVAGLMLGVRVGGLMH